MAIEPFRRRIGVAGGGSLISPNLPQLADVGPTLGRAGQSLAQAAEPVLKDKAITQAREMASAAELTRDDKGNLQKIETPEDGGILFNAAFDEIAKTRYVNQVSFDLQQKFDRLAEENLSDPDRLREQITGTLEGVMSTIPDEYRGEIEALAYREANERVRTVGMSYARERKAGELSGSLSQINQLQKSYLAAVRNGMDVGEAYVKFGQPADTLAQKLVDARAIAPEQYDAIMLETTDIVSTAEDIALSTATMSRFIPALTRIGNDQLEILDNWANNASDPRTIKINDVAVDFAAFQKAMPDASSRQRFREIVNDEIQVRRAKAAELRAAAREAEREAREAARLSAVVEAIERKDSAGLYGNYSKAERDLMDGQFAGSIAIARLADPKEQARALDFVQQRGYLPTQLQTYMTNNIRSGNWRAAAGLYRNLENVTTRHGQRIGDLFAAQLDGRTKAILNRAISLGATGTPDATIEAGIEQLRSGRGFQRDEAVGAYVKARGNKQGVYGVDRDAAIRKAYGIPPMQTIPAWLTRMIDDSYVANLDITNNPTEALRLGVTQNRGLYTKSKVFTGDVGPSALIRAAPPEVLARFFKDAKRPGGAALLPKGSSLGGNVKLMPLDGSAQEVGRYGVVVMDPKNPSRQIDYFELDMKAELDKWVKTQPKVPPPAKVDPFAAAAKARKAGLRQREAQDGNPGYPFLIQ